MVAVLLVYPERLFRSLSCRPELGELERERARTVQRPGTRRRRALVRADCTLEPPQALGRVASDRPEAPERPCQLQDELGFFFRLEAVESSSEVVVLDSECFQPLLRAAAVVRIRFLGDRDEIVRVPSSDLFCLTRFFEALGCVFADCFEHPVALVAVPEEALVDEGEEPVDVRVRNLLR